MHSPTKKMAVEPQGSKALMEPGRQQDAAANEGQPSHPVKRTAGIVFALVLMPLLVILAWNKAGQFDPYTMSFFTKTYVEPTPDMPEQMRIGGWVMIGLGALVGYAAINAMLKGVGTVGERLMTLWAAALVALFGASFFVAADAAKERIEQEIARETR